MATRRQQPEETHASDSDIVGHSLVDDAEDEEG